jgi:ABC-type oligopeptide transport system substrate-binding subunit
MTFKILPRQPYEDFALTKADDRRLGEQNPVGSGPFQYGGRRTQSGRPDAIVLVANPHYRKEESRGLAAAAGKSRVSHIREVHFYRPTDPVKDFGRDGSEAYLHLLLDLPASRVKELQQKVPHVQIPPPIPNRRIYFLAVNHRDGSPLKDRAGVAPDKDPGRLLRRAVALAIKREEILDSCFRTEPKEKAHRPLNGPYPPDSWACDTSLRSLDQEDVAKTLARAAEKAGLATKRLSLKYPDDDPQVESAMRLLKQQVEQTLADVGIELDLKPLKPHTLRQHVEQRHDYELAYYYYDYPSEAYWLWPLFDPRGTGGGRGNYLQYSDDSELESLFRQAMGHREFSEVRRLTRLIHGVIHHKLPLIPLWQLDTRVALHPDLKTGSGDKNVPFEPLLVFTEIEKWRLEKK